LYVRVHEADWRHFGRLAGFTNQKPTRCLDNGFAAFVRLHEWSGHVYGKAEEYLEQVSAELANAATDRAATQRVQPCTITLGNNLHHHTWQQDDVVDDWLAPLRRLSVALHFVRAAPKSGMTSPPVASGAEVGTIHSGPKAL
jgi:hypothetical protein